MWYRSSLRNHMITNRLSRRVKQPRLALRTSRLCQPPQPQVKFSLNWRRVHCLRRIIELCHCHQLKNWTWGWYSVLSLRKVQFHRQGVLWRVSARPMQDKKRKNEWVKYCRRGPHLKSSRLQRTRATTKSRASKWTARITRWSKRIATPVILSWGIPAIHTRSSSTRSCLAPKLTFNSHTADLFSN